MGAAKRRLQVGISHTYAPPRLSAILEDYLSPYSDVSRLEPFVFAPRIQDHYILIQYSDNTSSYEGNFPIVRLAKDIIRKLFPPRKVDLSDIEPNQIQVANQIEEHFRNNLRIYHHIKIVYLYLAEKAISQWNDLPPEKKIKYARKSLQVIRGELPLKFINHFVKRAFEADGPFGILYEGERFHNEALKWYANLLTQAPPDPLKVERQLENLWPSLRNIESLRFLFPNLAKIAIAHWMKLPLDLKISALDIKTSWSPVKDPNEDLIPPLGELPPRFLRLFIDRDLSQKGIDYIKKYAATLMRVAEIEPAIFEKGFTVIKQKTVYLLKIWNTLPSSIQREEFGDEGGEGLPFAFIEFSQPHSIYLGKDPAQLLTRAEEPWSYESNRQGQIVWHGINLTRAMEDLVQENEDLAYYPKFLELRAQALILAWERLPHEEKIALWEEDEKMGRPMEAYVIPKSFSARWHLSQFGIGELLSKKKKHSGGGNINSSGSGQGPNQNINMGSDPAASSRGSHSLPYQMNARAVRPSRLPVPIFRGALTMTTRRLPIFRFYRAMPAFAI